MAPGVNFRVDTGQFSGDTDTTDYTDWQEIVAADHSHVADPLGGDFCLLTKRCEARGVICGHHPQPTGWHRL
jgi:hypothetical protein